jgi:predicted amidophosphoribosyltransferase
MPSVAELTAVYGNFLIGPRHGDDICELCFNLTDGFQRCYACASHPNRIDVVAPISYSIGGEQLHHALASYKRLGGEPARRFTVEIAAILWRHLARHERCLALAAGLRAERFELVTTVPSTDPTRDARHPLRTIVGGLTCPTRERYERILRRTGAQVRARAFDPDKYEATRPLDGAPVLLIDDTWTTGASAQSAAHALKTAGAGPVATVVVGRHVNRGWRENNSRLSARQRPFDWDVCPFCEADR